MTLHRPQANQAIPWIVGIGIAALHYTVACARYANFTYTSWDLGIFTQVVNDYAHFRAPIATIHGPGFNVLGDHFSPILALLAPLFWIWQSPIMLLLAQAVAFGISAIPITRLARTRLGAPSGTALGIAYGLSAGLFGATLVDFHEVAFAVPCVSFALVALVERRWHAVIWWSLPLLLVKEDLGFTVAAIGLVVAFRGARRAGLLLVIAGVAGSLLAVFAIIPILAPGHRYAYFSQYDGAHTHNSLSAVWQALRPSRWIAGFTQKLHTALTFGWAAAFAGWASSIVVIALPTFAWRFVSAQPSYWGTSWHYDAVLMPIAFVAAVETCERWTQREGTWRWLGTAVPVAALTVSITFASSSPLNILFDNATWTTTPAQRAEADVLREVPDNVVVLTDIGLMSHLAARDEVYLIGGSGTVLPDYIVTVDGAGWTPPDPADAASFWSSQYSGHQFALVSGIDGVTVLRRVF